MAETLFSVFPVPDDLLSLEPEELAGVLVEVAPSAIQNQSQSGMFSTSGLLAPLFPLHGALVIDGKLQGYPSNLQSSVRLAVAEALSWLTTQGLMIVDPDQPATWYRFTRRAQNLKTRSDVAAYRKGRMLPVELLPPTLVSKVWPLFLRGDHDVAVFQAYKEVEVSVRKAANTKLAAEVQYPDDLLGVSLMRRAFHPENGPLTDKRRVAGERDAEMHLFAGAIGHAKNPPGHRDVEISPVEAARLIVFAGYLLDLVAAR